MFIKKDFIEASDIDKIVIEMKAKGAMLVETQYHFDGNHLLFELPDRDLYAELDELKTRMTALENK